MKLLYYCHNCGDFIDELSVDELDEKKLGFDHLTLEEKRDIMKWNESGDMLYVGSICDACYDQLHNMLGDDLLDHNEYTMPKLH